MRPFTDEQRIQRVVDVLDIKNVMGRHAYFHAYDQHDRELDEIWVQEPENQKTASFGQNWGYQVGLDLIRKNYCDLNVKMRQDDLKALRAADSSIEDKPENLGIGSMLMHTLTTPYVEVAADGKTAQGLWYSPGQVTVAGPDGVEALWMYEKYGVDFIREAGGWKIWHLFVGTDLMLPAGADMTKEPVPEKLEAEQGMEGMELTYPMLAYTSRYNWSEYPIIPKPYETFADTVSNGPEGNPRFKGGKQA